MNWFNCDNFLGWLTGQLHHNDIDVNEHYSLLLLLYCYEMYAFCVLVMSVLQIGHCGSPLIINLHTVVKH